MSLSPKSYVRIHELMNVLVHLSQKATNILRVVQHEASLNIVQKGHCSSDVVTKIDLQIQKTLQYNLKNLYPNARIICEEDENCIEDGVKPSIMPDELIKLKNKQKIFKPEVLHKQAQIRRLQYLNYIDDLLAFNYSFIKNDDVKRGLDDVYNNEVLEKDLTFWIDPLDGSKGLVEGHTHHLTTIIGISIQNRPLLGVVHKPFGQDPLAFNSGKTYIGLPQCGLYTVLQNFNTDFGHFENYTRYVPAFNRDENIDKHLYQPKICGSHNKNQDSMDKLIYGTNPQKIERVAGSANKFVHMVENQSDLYINFVPGFKYWDMCGSEAILAARFGILTDAYKRPLFYNEDEHPTLKNGIIAAKNKQIYEICERRMEKFTGMSLQENHKLISDEAQRDRALRKAMREIEKIPDIKQQVIRDSL